jgi:hypothetical protein
VTTTNSRNASTDGHCPNANGYEAKTYVATIDMVESVNLQQFSLTFTGFPRLKFRGSNLNARTNIESPTSSCAVPIARSIAMVDRTRLVYASMAFGLGSDPYACVSCQRMWYNAKADMKIQCYLQEHRSGLKIQPSVLGSLHLVKHRIVLTTVVNTNKTTASLRRSALPSQRPVRVVFGSDLPRALSSVKQDQDASI